MTRITLGDSGYSNLAALLAAQKELIYDNVRWRAINDNAIVFISESIGDLYGELGSNPSGNYPTLEQRLNATDPPYTNVKSYGAKGDGVTDDTAAIQNAINLANKGDILFFPEGIYQFSHLTVNKAMGFVGAGYWFGHRPSFGSDGWLDFYITERGGTVLRCTATSGIAIEVTASVAFHMRDLMLQGTGNNTQTTTGVKTPGGDTGEYMNGGGTYYIANCYWDNVAICNFKVGLRFYATYQSHFSNMSLIGCDKGAQVGHDGNNIGFVTSTITALDSTSCNIVWQADNMGYSSFIGPTMQGYYDVGFKLNQCYSTYFISPYFEGITGNYAIDADICTTCQFVGGAFAGDGTHTKFRLGLNSVRNFYYSGGGGNTMIIAGSSNAIFDLDPSYITDTGIWNRYEYQKDISTSSPAATNYGRAIKFSLPDANHKGALVFEQNDPILISPDGSKWRITISNGGTISGTKLT